MAPSCPSFPRFRVGNAPLLTVGSYIHRIEQPRRTSTDAPEWPFRCIRPSACGVTEFSTWVSDLMRRTRLLNALLPSLRAVTMFHRERKGAFPTPRSRRTGGTLSARILLLRGTFWKIWFTPESASRCGLIRGHKCHAALLIGLNTSLLSCATGTIGSVFPVAGGSRGSNSVTSGQASMSFFSVVNW